MSSELDENSNTNLNLQQIVEDNEELRTARAVADLLSERLGNESQASESNDGTEISVVAEEVSDSSSSEDSTSLTEEQRDQIRSVFSDFQERFNDLSVRLTEQANEPETTATDTPVSENSTPQQLTAEQELEQQRLFSAFNQTQSAVIVAVSERVV